LFEAAKNRQGARYLIGARIKDIKGNICEEHDLWYGFSTGKYSAEFFQRVEWTVYSPATKQVLAKFETDGYAKHQPPSQEGIMTAFVESFADATDALAGNSRFFEVVSSDEIEIAEQRTEAQRGKENFVLLAVDETAISREPIGERLAEVVNGTVTVRMAMGHGSGFVISRDGYILTNNHVVETAKKVAVIFSNGVEVAADVLRRDKIRDVALLKVSARGLAPQPLRLEGGLNRLDTVYAAGTPTTEDLKATITKGIVSAFRDYDREGKLIQADVDISAGNSGGPLFDDRGNVVGISVAGYGPDGFSSGLNLFIPIERALQALNITLVEG
jgi:S1-C subfamily serine protease